MGDVREGFRFSSSKDRTELRQSVDNLKDHRDEKRS